MGRNLTARVLNANPIPVPSETDTAEPVVGEVIRPTLSVVRQNTTTVEAPAGVLSVRSNQNWWDGHQRAALAQLGLDGAPAADLMIFLQQCQRTGLDPFSKQIYLIGRFSRALGRKKWTIQTGIDGFRLIAERSRLYGGQTPVEWCGADGVWRDVWLSEEPPAAARVGIIRKDFAAPLYAVAHFREYAPKSKDNPAKFDGLWGTLSAHMIGKVAEALGLRKAFPNDMSGIYTDEEMAQADVEPESYIDGETEPETQPEAAPETEQDTEPEPTPEPELEPEVAAQERIDQADQPAAQPIGWDAAIDEALNGSNAVEDLKSLWYAAREVDPTNGALAECIETAALDAARQAEAGA